MATAALPTLRTARSSLLQRVTALVSSSPILSSSSLTRPSSALYAPATLSAALSLPSAAPAASLSLANLIPDSLAGLRDLLPPWVFAVPKRRTTHGAKRMRSSNKGLKEKQNLVSCPSCGAPKLAHHLCHECHVAFRKEIHREAKELREEAPRV
ncbi:hypothetical protein JCM10207_002382 [Rhodosporidiobolus poonsookiae]